MFVLKRLFVFVILLFSTASANADSIAISEKAEIEKFSQSVLDEVLNELVKVDRKEDKVKKFEEIFVSRFDMEYVSQFLLGRTYKKLSKDQIKDFVISFEEFNVYSWIVKFDLYDGQGVSLKSVTQAKKDNQAFVNILVQEKDSDEAFDLQFRLRKVGKEYKIADIKVIGSSMLITYKKEFKSLKLRAKQEGEDEFVYLLDFIKNKTLKMKEEYFK
ncbi:MAG: ABC transporter substrate-binding protein [Alphaproteobacteria bacterium]|jgi:phospholipid transport system substrate-binding protein|nr:ABC transporter substrate-binding protein [Alphaproteobacteria bacterium]